MKDNLLQPSSQQFEYPEEDPDYKGDQLDERLKSGPIEDRGCTDCFWCLLYVGAWAMLVAIGVFAFTQGDPDNVFVSYMSGGQVCGNGLQKGCPYAYISNFEQIGGTYASVCVKSCPSEANVDLTTCNGPVMQSAYPTSDFMMVCSPTSTAQESFIDAFTTILQFAAAETHIDDLDKVWPVSLTVCFLALIISIAVTYLIKWFAKCLIWTVLALHVIVLTTFGFLFFYSAKGDISSFHFSDSTWLYVFAYSFWLFAILSVILIVCYHKTVQLAIAVMKAAADFTRQVWEAAFVPLAVFVVVLLFFVFWLYSSTYLLACGTISPQSTSPFPSIELDSGVIWMLAGNFFSFYWNANFAMAFCQYVIASCCCMWYFSHMGAQLHRPVTKSITRGMMHHSGSIAFGSLILTLVFFLNLIFRVIHQIFKNSVQNNKAAEGCLKCWFGYCGCLLKCFEKFVRFLNQNAYIMIALEGENFCKSAHHAFYLISRNKGKVAVTDGIGEIFTTVANIFIGVTSAFIGFIMVTQISDFADKITSPVIPTIFFTFIALIIGSLFMNVFGMGVDTILLCYLADNELFKEAKSVPPALKEFLDIYYK